MNTTANNTIPATRNQAARNFCYRLGQQANEAWPLAMIAIERLVDAEFEAIRAFLDSNRGGIFAEHVLERMAGGATLGAAIQAEAEKWMARTTGPVQKRLYRIPLGLSYLEALVIYHSTRDEAF
jgi:hypothetical protein